jgi:hypothetical protein
MGDSHFVVAAGIPLRADSGGSSNFIPAKPPRHTPIASGYFYHMIDHISTRSRFDAPGAEPIVRKPALPQPGRFIVHRRTGFPLALARSMGSEMAPMSGQRRAARTII